MTLLTALRSLLQPSEAELARRALRKRLGRIKELQLRNAATRAASYLDRLESIGVPLPLDVTQQAPADQTSRPVLICEPVYETNQATGYPFGMKLATWEHTPKARYEQDPLFGWPIDFLGELSVNVPVSAFPREIYPERPTTLRTQIAQDAVRFQSRVWYEQIPQYSGPIGHLVNYTVGSGMTWDVVVKDRREKAEAPNYEQDGQSEPETDTALEAGKKSNPDESLAEEVQQWLDAFAAYRNNRLSERVEESVLNLFRDGEDALRLWPAPTPTSEEEETYPQIRSVDTSTIRGPHNEITGPWAYGVLTSWPRDYENVQAYNLWYSDNTQETVSPEELHLAKLWTVGPNVKRGVPLCYKIRKQLPQMSKLLDCIAVGEAARQAIPYVQQFSAADRGSVRAATPSMIDQHDAEWQSFYAAWAEGQHRGETIVPGTIPQINKGQEFVDTPQGRAESGAMAYRTLCEGIATAMQVPLWFVTGSADQENYASSLVSESPVVKTIGRTQRKICNHFKCILEYALGMAVKAGKFPIDTLSRVEVHCELPTPIARDPDQAIDSDLKLLDKKLLSPQHVCARNNLDFDEEQELLSQAEELGWENSIDQLPNEGLPPEGDGPPKPEKPNE